MSGGVIALMMVGLIGFLAGAYFAAEGDRVTGVALMGAGLVFQALTLRQLRIAKAKDHSDAGG